MTITDIARQFQTIFKTSYVKVMEFIFNNLSLHAKKFNAVKPPIYEYHNMFDYVT